MKVGIAVYCTKCYLQKAPRGRSTPIAIRYCDWDCDGYREDPRVGDLWPGETEEEFGFPVSADGTKEAA